MVAGLALVLLVGGLPGIVAGVGLVVAAERWLPRLEPRAQRLRRARTRADLPVAADLLAACLLSGSSLEEAAEAVAAALGGPVAERLTAVAAAVRLGSDPATVWRSLSEADVAFAPLARGFARAADTGAPVASIAERVAEDQRALRRADLEEAARRVGVRAVGPLGLCFLPAFVLVGILPLMVALAEASLAPLR